MPPPQNRLAHIAQTMRIWMTSLKRVLTRTARHTEVCLPTLSQRGPLTGNTTNVENIRNRAVACVACTLKRIVLWTCKNTAIQYLWLLLSTILSSHTVADCWHISEEKRHVKIRVFFDFRYPILGGWAIDYFFRAGSIPARIKYLYDLQIVVTGLAFLYASFLCCIYNAKFHKKKQLVLK